VLAALYLFVDDLESDFQRLADADKPPARAANG
jgi:hypothetical protein